MLARSALLFGVAALATTTHALFLSITEPPTNTTAAIGVISSINFSGPSGKRALVPLAPRQKSGGLGDATGCETSCSSAGDASALTAAASCTTLACECGIVFQVSSGCLQCIVTAAGITTDQITQQCTATGGGDGSSCATQCTAPGDAATINQIAACTDVACVCSAAATLSADPQCLACLLDAAQLSAADKAALDQQCAAGGNGTLTTSASGGVVGATTTAAAGTTLSQVPLSSVKGTGAATTTTAPASKPTGSITSAVSGSASASASGSSGAGIKVQGGLAACVGAMVLAMAVAISV